MWFLYLIFICNLYLIAINVPKKTFETRIFFFFFWKFLEKVNLISWTAFIYLFMLHMTNLSHFIYMLHFMSPSDINEAHPVWFHRDMSVTLYFDDQSRFIWCRCSPCHLFSLQWFWFLVHFFTNTNQVASAQTEIRLFVTDDENSKVYPADFKPYILSVMYFFP